jgi:uncharacterized protein (TIGR03086 family)
MDILSQLETQLQRNSRLIGGVSAAQMHAATPCKKFDARTLMNHMIGGNYYLNEVAKGHTVDSSGEPPDLVGSDPAASHKESAVSLMHTLREPDVMERTFKLPFGSVPGSTAVGIWMMEATIHGWDLAKATGQDTSIDPGVASMLLQGASAIDGIRTPEGHPFGPPVEVPNSASPGDKLVAYLGRQP